MSLSDMIEQDAKNVFCNPADFAEPVVYYKENGKARHINAVVIRDALAILPEDGDTITPVFEVHVANDGVEGILSEELNLGGDQIAFSPRVGKQVERRTVTRLLGHDNGMLQQECR